MSWLERRSRAAHRSRPATDRRHVFGILELPSGWRPAWWPEDLFGGWRLDSVREVVLHVLVETSTHAGHLDSARELIDGRTWLVVD